MRSTKITRHINAPRSRVYNALIDPDLIPQWKVPTGMTCHIHSFDGREGGKFRISLTYQEQGKGKTSAHTDTYHGRFIKLIPDELVVEEDEFETADASLSGVMTVTIQLSDANGGTDIVGIHEGLPDGVTIADNELGWRLAFDKLAALMEAG
jgi:uncharacterized protein YndB with AHSA1/START domain